MAETITCAQLIARTQRWLLGMHARPLNALELAVDEDDTELKVLYGTEVLTANTYVGIDDEIVYVWEVNQGNKTLQVSRGQLGTEAAEHAVGAVVEPNSRFPRAAIKDALQEEIRAWPDGLFQVKARTLELARDQSSVDLGLTNSRFTHILNVARAPRQMINGADKWTSLEFRVDRLMPRDSYPSGSALTFYERIPEASTIRVLYGAAFEVGDMGDDLDVTDGWGMPTSMVDIPPVGAAARLLQASEILRSDTEAMLESRIAAEVPATYQSQTADKLRLWAMRRIGEEANRLRSRYRMPS